MGCCVPTSDTGDHSSDLRNANASSSQITANPRALPQNSLETDQMKTAKVIVMGNASVGKTSIINSFMENASQRGKHTQNTNVIQDFTKVQNVTDSKGNKHRL